MCLYTTTYTYLDLPVGGQLAQTVLDVLLLHLGALKRADGEVPAKLIMHVMGLTFL